ncbi:hypothetical protein [Meiothermus granaticius]|uniref:Uncharacterized protein n=1 Tax=Meiothermus granaticius NBRC 107808 TaxID=1227551 RepID=A0A399F3A9_9DEIN|nr:hypothetical protein [Meiothermus granaticius]RIH91174.1 hypothetical protein Mgrana_02958 [Meiothermus granaticius NBRC 107808]GEM88375.1 hypothetical protein MGR01S_30000 [Meiothermus granaticius NBRC 107808]
MRKYRQLSQIGVSYLEKAPDHGQPELAVLFPVSRRRHRVVPIAVGEEATRLWQQPLGEEALIKLAAGQNPEQGKAAPA